MNSGIFLIAAAAAAAVFSAPALAADDPIAIRQALMKSVGANAGVAGAMLKGEIEYNPAVAKGVLAALNASAHAYGEFFPEGSAGTDTIASPKIWEDAAGFAAELDKFRSATSAAVQAAGKEGPADLEAFKAAVGPAFGSCKSCHQGYRIKK